MFWIARRVLLDPRLEGMPSKRTGSLWNWLPTTLSSPTRSKDWAPASPPKGPDKLDEAKVYMQQAIQRGQDLGTDAVASDAKLQLGKIYYNQKSYESATHAIPTPTCKESTNTARVAEALYSCWKVASQPAVLYGSHQSLETAHRQLPFFPYRIKAYLWRPGETQFGLGPY